MRVVITGGAGFIGSNLADYLHKKNYKVIIYDKYNSFNNFGWIENSKYKNFFDVRLGDIRDFDITKKSCSDCDIILHLAALIGIPYSFNAPSSYLETNINGTLNICEIVKTSKIKKLIITSTSEVYGSAQNIPMTEEHVINPQSPYAATKIAADHLAMSYYYSFKLPISILRPFNVYGPRQSDRAVIPTIINQMINKNNKYVNLGNINSRRDYTYVEDVCRAYETLMTSKNTNGKFYHTSNNENYSIEEIFHLIKSKLKSKKKLKIVKNRFRPNNSEVNELLGDNSKINEDLNWSPVTNFNKGLVKTIKWYTQNSNFINSKSENYVL